MVMMSLHNNKTLMQTVVNNVTEHPFQYIRLLKYFGTTITKEQIRSERFPVILVTTPFFSSTPGTSEHANTSLVRDVVQYVTACLVCNRPWAQPPVPESKNNLSSKVYWNVFVHC